MQASQAGHAPQVTGGARRALDLVHHLLTAPAADQPALDDLLRQLAAAFESSAAGLAALAGGNPTPRCRVGDDWPGTGARWPWDVDPALPGRLAPAAPAITVNY